MAMQRKLTVTKTKLCGLRRNRKDPLILRYIAIFAFNASDLRQTCIQLHAGDY